MRVVIVGGGKIGSYLASKLQSGNHEVRIIDIRPETAARLQKTLGAETVLSGSGTDPNLLEAAGIQQAHVLAAVTGNDETNLVVAGLGRFEYGVPRIIGRVIDPRNAWLYSPEMGIDVALNQADIMGNLIAEEMSLGDMMTLLKLRKGQFSLVEVKVASDSVAANKPIRELVLPADCVLTAIIRRGELIIPKGDTVLRTADEVLAVVGQAELSQLASLLESAI